MAKVAFGSMIESVTGKLSGSVFQDSYGGWQVRTRVTPRNPQSTLQQLRRGEFGYISALWRSLTLAQRGTFIAAAGTPPQALNLFISSNVNLSLINVNVINSYTVQSVPVTFPLSIVLISPSSFSVTAAGSPSTVPANCKLLIYATVDKAATLIFTNPSQYSPIISYDEGTVMSGSIDIISYWMALYGILRPNKRICLKSVLIDKRNGLRGAESIVCSISSPIIVGNMITDDAGNMLVDDVVNYISYP